MASERETALSAVIESRTTEPRELEEAITLASTTAEQLKLTHQHEMAMKQADLGWFGRLFGAEEQASIVVAFVVIILGFSASFGLWWIAYSTGKVEFWSGEAHIALGAATSALGYVFGRGSKNHHKR